MGDGKGPGKGGGRGNRLLSSRGKSLPGSLPLRAEATEGSGPSPSRRGTTNSRGVGSVGTIKVTHGVISKRPHPSTATAWCSPCGSPAQPCVSQSSVSIVPCRREVNEDSAEAPRRSRRPLPTLGNLAAPT